jgi:hypothetical protein
MKERRESEKEREGEKERRREGEKEIHYSNWR